MRTRALFGRTLREVASHGLLLRAGFVRRLETEALSGMPAVET